MGGIGLFPGVRGNFSPLVCSGDWGCCERCWDEGIVSCLVGRDFVGHCLNEMACCWNFVGRGVVLYRRLFGTKVFCGLQKWFAAWEWPCKLAWKSLCFYFLSQDCVFCFVFSLTLGMESYNMKRMGEEFSYFYCA